MTIVVGCYDGNGRDAGLSVCSGKGRSSHAEQEKESEEQVREARRRRQMELMARFKSQVSCR
jgi:hypothetical protein